MLGMLTLKEKLSLGHQSQTISYCLFSQRHMNVLTVDRLVLSFSNCIMVALGFSFRVFVCCVYLWFWYFNLSMVEDLISLSTQWSLKPFFPLVIARFSPEALNWLLIRGLLRYFAICNAESDIASSGYHCWTLWHMQGCACLYLDGFCWVACLGPVYLCVEVFLEKTMKGELYQESPP